MITLIYRGDGELRPQGALDLPVLMVPAKEGLLLYRWLRDASNLFSTSAEQSKPNLDEHGRRKSISMVYVDITCLHTRTPSILDSDYVKKKTKSSRYGRAVSLAGHPNTVIHNPT